MNWRTQPVFVSGTFRDFHQERDMLAVRAFPALEERLAKYDTVLERVDLRVGIETTGLSDDHARQELVLKVCLEDVRRCRPFLIVMIGDRYGWVPSEDRARAAVEEAGFPTEPKGKSVTALEIDFGLFGDSDRQARSRIYFRTLDYVGMDEPRAIAYSDARAASSMLLPTKERDRAAERAAELEILKGRLRSHPVLGSRCRDYRARWDPKAERVTGLGPFVEAVIEDLSAELIDEARLRVVAAKGAQLPTPLEQFVTERSRGFRGRSGIVERLFRHATMHSDAGRGGLLLVGASGSGKSAIFARVYEELSHDGQTDFCLLAHAAGMDLQSTSSVSMLERWVALLASKLGVTNRLEIPASLSDPREPLSTVGASQAALRLQSVFADLLTQAAANGSVVLLIDALDKLDRAPNSGHLKWLPVPLPPNVRVVATCLMEPEVETVAERSDFVVERLAPLTLEEAREICFSVYDRYHRQPNLDAIAELLEKVGPDGAPARHSPLWLVSALEELNLLDGDDFQRAESRPDTTPGDQLHSFVTGEARELPGDLPGLYARTFARVGRRVSDDSLEGSLLARAFTAAIALSRGGLRERDFAALIPSVAQVFAPSSLPPRWDALTFASLRRALRAHLMRRGADDRWDFHHDQARSGAERAFVANDGARKRIHDLIANHFLGLPIDDPLRESEAMYHLIRGDAREKAARLYAADLTPRALDGSREALATHALEEKGLAWVTSLLTLEELQPDVLVALGERYLFDLDAAFDRMYVLEPRAVLAQAALRLFRELAVNNSRHSGLLRYLGISLVRVGRVEEMRGNLDAASKFLQEGLAILRELSDSTSSESIRDVAVALHSVWDVEIARGKLDNASAASAEGLEIARRLSNSALPESQWDILDPLERVGRVEMIRGNLDGASAAFSEMLSIARRLPEDGGFEGSRSLATALNYVGQIEAMRGNLETAYTVYTESLAIRRGLLDRSRPKSFRDLSLSLDNVAEVERSRGNIDEAAAAYIESLSICRKLSDPTRPQSLRDLTVSLDHAGLVEMDRGNLDAAYAAYAEMLQIARGLVDAGRPESLRDLSVSLSNVGRVDLMRGRHDAAFAAFAEMHKILRDASDPARPDSLRDLSLSLGHVGELELLRGNLSAAASAYGERLRIARELLDREQPQSVHDLWHALGKVGEVELRRGNLDSASAAFAESVAISRTLSDVEGPESIRAVYVSLLYLGYAEAALGNLDTAAKAFNESLEIARSLASNSRPETLLDMSVSLLNIGRIERLRGNLDAAAAAAAENLEITRGLADASRPESTRAVAISLDNVAEIEVERGSLDAAAAAYSQSLEIRRQLYDLTQPQSLQEMSTSLNRLGQVEMMRGNDSEAQSLFHFSLSLMRKLPPSLRREVAWVQDQLRHLQSRRP